MNYSTTSAIKYFISLAVIFALSATTSCDQMQVAIDKVTKTPKPMNTIVLIDLSSSIPQTTVNGYLASVELDIFSKITGTDKLYVLPVDYGSEGSFRELLHLDLSDYEPEQVALSKLQQENYYRSQLEKYKNEHLLPSLRENLGSAASDRLRYNRGTDVIGACRVATKYIDPRYRNLVVIFSDMIQETEVINMERSMKSEDQVAALLSKTETLRMAGAEIIVITGEQPSIDIMKYHRIKTYWEQLADREGWNLLDYSSGSKEALRKWLAQE